MDPLGFSLDISGIPAAAQVSESKSESAIAVPLLSRHSSASSVFLGPLFKKVGEAKGTATRARSIHAGATF
jgi:hypothetical protein